MLVNQLFKRVVAVGCAAALSACASLGPNYLAAGRPLYNEAVQETDAQQLLLNIVRQRYNDPVLFLDVTSITSKATYSVGGNVRAAIPFSGTGSLTPELGPRIEDSPLIFYTPNNGEKFVRQVLTPLDIRTLTLVLQAGWSIERVLLLTGESLAGLRNTSGEYRALVAALRDLQRSGDVMIGVDAAGTAPAVVFTFSPAVRETASYKTVCQAFRAACGGESIQVRHGFGAAAASGAPASLATRSLYSALYFLADAVDVPPGDDSAARGRSQGGPDERLFRVRSSATEPAAASVKVRYRNAWFYIADTDGDSKVTFALLSMLLTLQAGDTNKVTPLITLPAG